MTKSGDFLELLLVAGQAGAAYSDTQRLLKMQLSVFVAHLIHIRSSIDILYTSDSYLHHIQTQKLHLGRDAQGFNVLAM